MHTIYHLAEAKVLHHSQCEFNCHWFNFNEALRNNITQHKMIIVYVKLWHEKWRTTCIPFISVQLT